MSDDTRPDCTEDPTLKEMARLKAENNELEAIFDLRWKADMRAVGMWRRRTGEHLTLPDHADLVVWLLEEIQATKKEASDLSDLLDQIEDEKDDFERSLEGLTAEKARLIGILSDAEYIAQKFMKKVDDGHARSVETYAELKRLRDAIMAEIGDHK